MTEWNYCIVYHMCDAFTVGY